MRKGGRFDDHTTIKPAFRPVSPAAQAKGERVFCAAVALLLVLSEVFQLQHSKHTAHIQPCVPHCLNRYGGGVAGCPKPAADPVADQTAGADDCRVGRFCGVYRTAGATNGFCLPFCLALVPRMLICVGCCGSTLPQRLAGCWRCSCCTPQRRWCPTCTTAATGITAMAITTGTVPGWPVCFLPGAGCVGRACAGGTGAAWLPWQPTRCWCPAAAGQALPWYCCWFCFCCSVPCPPF